MSEQLTSGYSRIQSSLRVHSPELRPGDVSELLQVEPTSAFLRGDQYGKRGMVRRVGMWRLQSSESWPCDLDTHVRSLVKSSPASVSIWQKLSKEYRVDLFIGMWLEKEAPSFVLLPESLMLLAERGIAISINSYALGEDGATDPSSLPHP